MSTQQIRTALEKAVVLYTKDLKESVKDFMMLYNNKKDLGIDRDKLEKLVDVCQLGIEEQASIKLDHLMRKFDALLSEYEKEVATNSVPKLLARAKASTASDAEQK